MLSSSDPPSSSPERAGAPQDGARRTAEATPAPAVRRRRVRAAVLSYLGMVAAMYVGMVVLSAGRQLFLPGPVLGGDVEVLLMAGEMTVGMAVWMIIRRHPWRAITVMSVGMVLPFLLLLPVFWAGALSADGLMTVGHVLMFGTMALAMPLAHPAGHHHAGAVAVASPARPTGDRSGTLAPAPSAQETARLRRSQGGVS